MSDEHITERAHYATPSNLLSRVALHSYTSNPNWSDWLWEREVLSHAADGVTLRILDVGCGPGGLWSGRLDVDPSWRVTLADASSGMLDAAHLELGGDYTYVLSDIAELPFEDGAFDVVLANHMLYHVPDRPRALAEVARVLRRGGSFHASCNGRGHLAELAALTPAMSVLLETQERFGLETGPSQLEPHFTDLRVERFDTHLAVPRVEPVIAYIRSSMAYAGEDLSEALDTVQTAIATHGVFDITSLPGLISAQRP